MRISRRQFLTLTAGTAAGAAAWYYWPEDGFWNPCLTGALPAPLAGHELVQAAWNGIDPLQVWDGHVHLAGLGDSGSGMWASPKMDTLRHPFQWLQKKFYLNASCTERSGETDRDYIARLLSLLEDFRPGAKLVLLAFDWAHDSAGLRRQDLSAFHAPNEYAAALAKKHPQFEWIASIHPYRADAVDALDKAAATGARAIKWLPPVHGIDPASPKCDRFYEAMARHRLPLLTHAGAEQAVASSESAEFGNPLKLRRPMDHGVTVIVAHSASLGHGKDLDKGPGGPSRPNFDLFARLMDEKRYEKQLYGEISAVTQINRVGKPLQTLLERVDWHPRLLNASDYPLPAVMPLFSLKQLTRDRYIGAAEAKVLSEIRRHNPLLFDFVLKRTLRLGAKRFADEVFHTRRVFERPSAAAPPRPTPPGSPPPRRQ
jgi:mannonate dehydratase